MVDAPASGAGVCMDVEVRVLSWAPLFQYVLIYFNELEKSWCILPTFASTLSPYSFGVQIAVQ